MKLIYVKKLLTCFYLNHIKIQRVDKALNYKTGTTSKRTFPALLQTYLQSLFQSLSELADFMVW